MPGKVASPPHRGRVKGAPERVFFLIKPDGLPRAREIMAILEPKVKVMASRRFPRAPFRRIAALYSEHEGKPFHPWLMAAMKGRPVKAFLLEARSRGLRPGELHRMVARLVGDTDPRKAAPGTVRALSDDDMTLSMSQGRVVRNLVHRGRTPEESLREAAIFFHDRTGPEALAVEPGPLSLAIVDPVANVCRGVSGMLFEERLASALRIMGFIPAGARLVAYAESVRRGRRGEAGPVVMSFDYSSGGRLRHLEVEALG